MHLRTMSPSTTKGALENMVIDIEGGDIYECLAPKISTVSSLYVATSDDPNTFTIVVKFPSTTLRRHCLML